MFPKKLIAFQQGMKRKANSVPVIPIAILSRQPRLI